MQKYFYGDDDAFDEYGRLKDGKSLRFPMQFMDSMQRSVAAAMTVDQMLMDEGTQAKAMQAAHSVLAHRGGAREGDAFMLNGIPLVVVRDANGRLRCKSHPLSDDAWQRRPA